MSDDGLNLKKQSGLLDEFGDKEYQGEADLFRVIYLKII